MKKIALLLGLLCAMPAMGDTPIAVLNTNTGSYVNLTLAGSNTTIGSAPSSVTSGNCVKFNSATGALADVGFPCGSGSGSVTSFSAGDLSPLFTTSVATSTSTPALTFTLTNAAANTLLGNNTGSSAAPSYTAMSGIPLSKFGLGIGLTGYLYGNGSSAITASTTIPVAAVTGAEQTANKDAASGYAGLTAGSLLKTAEMPAFTGDCTTSAGAVALTCTAKPILGNKVTLTGSGNWTVPAGVTSVMVKLIGAGAGGGATAGTTAASGAAGTSGAYILAVYSGLTPGSTIAYAVGAKGTGGAAGNNPGTNGGDTTFGVLTAKGGLGGTGSASGNAAGVTAAAFKVIRPTFIDTATVSVLNASVSAVLAAATAGVGGTGGMLFNGVGGDGATAPGACSAATGNGNGGGGGSNLAAGAASAGCDGSDGTIEIFYQ